VSARGDMIFIGRLRREWFIPCTSDWNGLVRDVSASLEQQGGSVSQSAFHLEMLKQLQKQEFAKGFAQTMQLVAAPGREGEK